MRFEEISLVDCAAYIVDNRGKTCPVGDTGRPLIATNCLRDGSLYPTYETTRFVSEETYRTWFRGHPEPGDLIFVTKGSPGRVCLAPNPVDFCIAQDMVAIRANERKVYSKYLFAVLRSDEAQRRIANMHVGTLIPHFKKGDFDKLFLPIPPRPVQEFIGDLYFDLSARIDLLQRTNTTLESIAQALFKSWFIDFDPVRAKQVGREPEGMDTATAALFPAEFEESALGLIPKGWSIRSLDSLATYLNGLALQKFPPESDDEFLPVIKIAQLRAGSTSGADRASARLKPEYVVHDGDVLFSWSGSLEVEFWCGGDGALNQHLFKVSSAEVPKWFYYLATRHFLHDFREIAAHKATTMGHIQRKHLTEARLAVPPTSMLAAFGQLIGPLLDRRIANSLQARELAALRDTLLPRLISGKLRLPKARAEIEEALA